MRRPTSGGLGFGSRPSWTARNCSQTDRDSTEVTGVSASSPDRWSSRCSPQMPVRRVGSFAEHPDIGPKRRDRPATRIHRDQRTGREPGHHHGPDVDRTPIVLQPGGDLRDVFAREVGDRVEHVGPGVEEEAAARQLRDLPPSPGRMRSPVLPDDRRDVEDPTDLAARDHPRCGPDLRRQAARERDDQEPSRAVARLDQALGLGGREHHRLLEEHVEARLEGGGACAR